MAKTLRAFGLVGALTMASAGAWLACGDDTGNGATGGSDSGTESGSGSGSGGSSGSGSSSGVKNSSSSGSGGSSSSSSSGSSSSGGGGSDAGDAGAAVSCATYCAAIQKACTGANQQYATDPDGGSVACANACKYFDTGDAAMGNTLLCHYEHANFAAMSPIPHCWHAGPYGWGVCGNQCDDFCNLVTQYCSPAGGFTLDAGQPPYPSLMECTTKCEMFTMNGDDSGAAIVTDAASPAANSFSANSSTAPTSGNTLDCREYHLGAALQSPPQTNQLLHCQHPGVNSPTCM